MRPQVYLFAVPLVAASFAEAHMAFMNKRHGQSPFSNIQPQAVPAHQKGTDALGVFFGGQDKVWGDWQAALPGDARGPCTASSTPTFPPIHPSHLLF